MGAVAFEENQGIDCTHSVGGTIVWATLQQWLRDRGQLIDVNKERPGVAQKGVEGEVSSDDSRGIPCRESISNEFLGDMARKKN